MSKAEELVILIQTQAGNLDVFASVGENNFVRAVLPLTAAE